MPLFGKILVDVVLQLLFRACIVSPSIIPCNIHINKIKVILKSQHPHHSFIFLKLVSLFLSFLPAQTPFPDSQFIISQKPSANRKPSHSFHRLLTSYFLVIIQQPIIKHQIVQHFNTLFLTDHHPIIENPSIPTVRFSSCKMAYA